LPTSSQQPWQLPKLGEPDYRWAGVAVIIVIIGLGVFVGERRVSKREPKMPKEKVKEPKVPRDKTPYPKWK